MPMATYVISDVHGQFCAFISLLEKIGFGSTDQLYVLGDIIDRGPETGLMVNYAMNRATPNIHFLRGNHEDMALSFYQGTDPYNIWFMNDGINSHNQIMVELENNMPKDEFIDWVKGLKPYAITYVNGRPWMLVHAAIDPSQVNPKVPAYIPTADYNMMRKTFDLTEYGLGFQASEIMLWGREDYLNWNEKAPIPIVSGHTSVQSRAFKFPRTRVTWTQNTRGEGHIRRYKNRFCIDCGAGHADYYKHAYVAALRLDDLAEFYVEVN